MDLNDLGKDNNKRCTKCKKFLPLGDFYQYKKRRKGTGLPSYREKCKKCTLKMEIPRSMKWREKDRATRRKTIILTQDGGEW